jgi:hypothetical protein
MPRKKSSHELETVISSYEPILSTRARHRHFFKSRQKRAARRLLERDEDDDDDDDSVKSSDSGDDSSSITTLSLTISTPVTAAATLAATTVCKIHFLLRLFSHCVIDKLAWCDVYFNLGGCCLIKFSSNNSKFFKAKYIFSIQPAHCNIRQAQLVLAVPQLLYRPPMQYKFNHH